MEELSGMSDEALGALVVDLHRQRAVLEARLVEATGVFDARAGWARDGARSGPAWVAARTGTSHHRARGEVGLARLLRSMPATADAFRSGRLGREQVDALVRAREGLEGPFDMVEAVLVDEVAEATVAAGQRFLRRWAAEVRERLLLQGDDPTPPGDDGGRSRVCLSQTFEGRWVLDATLDAESGEVVANAIDAVVDAMFRDGQFHHDDGLVPAERRAVALVEVVTRGTAGGDDDGTARPLVVGVIDLRPDPTTVDDATGPTGPTGPTDPTDPTDDSGPAGGPDVIGVPFGAVPGGLLAGRLLVDPAAVAELDRAGVVDRPTLERWVCEGTVQTIVVGPGPDELRLGRKVRVATRAQRRALRARDGHCAFPGCGAPPQHCQAHHIVWWEHGGPTDVENLVLLCRWHHKVVHQQGFTVERTDGQVVVRRPDRTRVTGTRTVRCDTRRLRRVPPGPGDPDPDEAHLTALTRCRTDALIRAAASGRATTGPSG